MRHAHIGIQRPLLLCSFNARICNKFKEEYLIRLISGIAEILCANTEGRMSMFVMACFQLYLLKLENGDIANKKDRMLLFLVKACLQYCGTVRRH